MIILKECKNPADKSLFTQVINDNHSYIKHKRTPTRRIDYLVYEEQSKNLIGAIGLNSATLNLKSRDEYLGFSKKLKFKRLKNIANNYRFALIKENITIDNAGSQALKQLRVRGAKRWKSKYGNKLIGIETFVKPPWTGSVYKSDNWQYLGKTSGWSIKRFPGRLIKKHLYKKQLKNFQKKYKLEKNVKSIYKKGIKKLIFFKKL